MPDFRKAFEHFLIHTGSKTVIDSVGANLKLPQAMVDPSAETLWFYGNTCVASTFYILANVESRVHPCPFPVSAAAMLLDHR